MSLAIFIRVSTVRWNAKLGSTLIDSIQIQIPRLIVLYSVLRARLRNFSNLRG